MKRIECPSYLFIDCLKMIVRKLNGLKHADRFNDKLAQVKAAFGDKMMKWIP